MLAVRCIAAVSFCLFSAAVSAAASRPAHSADWCKKFAARLPGVTEAGCQRSGLAPGGQSAKGFPLLVRDVPASGRKDPVRILLIGGIHGDELTAAAIVFQWMQWMHNAPASNFQWRVVPVANPDGLLATKPQRMNANGVDLNRNFPTPGWQQDAPRYWVKTTGSDPRRFPGKAPLSEPESRWLNQEIERFKPHVVVSVHAPFGVLDFDGPAPVPQRFGRLVLNPVGVYPGSLGNYGGVHKNVPVITLELPNALAMPPEADIRRIWMDMLQWIETHVPQKKPAAAPVQRTVAKAR